MEEWYAVSAAQLTGNVITITPVAGGDFMTAAVFAISGANTTTIFDSSPSLPAIGGGQGLGATPLSINTVASTTLVYGAYHTATASPIAGAGFTTVFGANQLLIEAATVSVPQNGLTLTLGGGDTSEVNAVADAVVAHA
jgi:hypothetical protein